MMKVRAVLLLMLGTCGGVAKGQELTGEPSSLEPKPSLSETYCDYVEGAAASEAARLMAPTVFGSAGIFNSETVVAPSAISDSERNRGRLLIGGDFSLGGVQRGRAIKRRARAN